MKNVCTIAAIIFCAIISNISVYASDPFQGPTTTNDHYYTQENQPYAQQPYAQQPPQQPYAQQPPQQPPQQPYAQQPPQQPYAQQPYAQQPYAQQPYAQQPYAQQPPQQPYAYNSYPSPYGGYYGYGYGGGIYNDPMLWNDPLSIGIIQMLTTSCRLLSESPDIINQTKENIRAYVNIASGLYSGQVIDTNLIEKVATKTIKTCQNNPDLLYGKALYLSLTSSGVSIKSLLNLDIFSKNNSNNSNNSINSNKTYSSNPNSTQKSQDSHSTTDTGTYTYPNSTGTPSDYSPNNGGTYYTNPNKGKY